MVVMVMTNGMDQGIRLAMEYGLRFNFTNVVRVRDVSYFSHLSIHACMHRKE